jgi:hypothetical protein
MKKLLAIIGLVFLLAACNVQLSPTFDTEANYWQQVGGIVGKGDYSSIALNSFEDPIVAYSDYTNGITSLRVKYWNGQIWKQLGNNLDRGNFSYARQSSLALDKDGNPFVAWDEQGVDANGLQRYYLYVAQWNGSWQYGLSQTSISGGYSDPSIRVDSKNRPVIAYQQYENSDYKIFVQRWDGTKWNRIGGTLNPGIGLNGFRPSLALDANDNPVVVWNQPRILSSGNMVWPIAAKRWDGSKWVSLGNVNPLQNSYSPASLTIDANNNPVVAYDQFGYDSFGVGSGSVYVKRWDGSKWVQLGGALDMNFSFEAVYPRVAMSTNNSPVVVWMEDDVSDGYNYQIYAKRWNGSKWVLVGTDAIDINKSRGTSSPFIASVQGRVAVSWTERNSIYVKRYRTNAWIP